MDILMIYTLIPRLHMSQSVTLRGSADVGYSSILPGCSIPLQAEAVDVPPVHRKSVRFWQLLLNVAQSGKGFLRNVEALASCETCQDNRTRLSPNSSPVSESMQGNT